MQPQSTHRVEVAEDLRPFAATALSRLGYLHPNWRLRIEASTIIADVADAESVETIVREIRYALYREKILTETMDMRRSLLRMVSRP
ncbi:MAG: hypothetical protein H6R00_359 [Proteobacteria bacterium]|nr:hypothetical protein [Pseudomonadota bacterium]